MGPLNFTILVNYLGLGVCLESGSGARRSVKGQGLVGQKSLAAVQHVTDHLLGEGDGFAPEAVDINLLPFGLGQGDVGLGAGIGGGRRLGFGDQCWFEDALRFQ